VLTVLAASGLSRKQVRRSGERSGSASGGDDDAPAAYDVEVHVGHNVQPHPVANTGKSFDASRPFHATITARRELQSKQSGRSTMHVEVDLQGSGLSYVTGDHLGVCAENHPAIVEAVAYKLGVHINDIITVTEGSSKAARRKSADGTSASRGSLARLATLPHLPAPSTNTICPTQ
jgi:sulfite reductase alpha subunit-like flavoprotein